MRSENFGMTIISWVIFEMRVIQSSFQARITHNQQRNYINFQKLVTVIGKLRQFVTEISQMNSILKFIRVKELNNEFDSTIQLLQSSLIIYDDYKMILKADIEDSTEVII